MVFKANLNYLGVQQITSKTTNKSYNKVAFVDGDESLSIFVNNDIAKKINDLGITRFQLVECTFNMVITQNENKLYLDDINVLAPVAKKG